MHLSLHQSVIFECACELEFCGSHCGQLLNIFCLNLISLRLKVILVIGAFKIH